VTAPTEDPQSQIGTEGSVLQIGTEDSALDEALSDGLDVVNAAATPGIADQTPLTVKVCDETGALVAGLSGWTWGTCAGIAMVWVREDSRGDGWGAQLLAAAEGEALRRGCHQVTVSSFTFQAPEFYQRHGYVEYARTEGLPVAGMADVHLRKDLAPTDA
jgi:GNAT superfamily N-acetyltransferase